MKKPNVTALFKSIQTSLSKHSPEILTGIGIAGMITTTVLAVKATPKALELIEDRKEELDMHPADDLSPVEVVKAAWKPYIPAAATGVASIVCLIGASSVNSKRSAALATAYNLTATAFNEYKEKTLETVGEKKEQVIRNKVAEERINKDPAKQSTIIVTGKGSTRCFDTITKQRFVSDIESVKSIVNELNHRMIKGDDYVSLNDLYYELGLDPTKFGDDIGWNVNTGLIEINFSAQLDTDGVPCIVLDYTVAPKRGFNEYCYRY